MYSTFLIMTIEAVKSKCREQEHDKNNGVHCVAYMDRGKGRGRRQQSQEQGRSDRIEHLLSPKQLFGKVEIAINITCYHHKILRRNEL